MITKFDEIPDSLLEYTDADLEDEDFADDVNRLFPINSEEAVAQSFAILKDNPYKDYSKADILYLLDRTCRAADKFDVNLDDLLESLGGEIMSVDTNSSEFRDAVKAETDRVMADFVDKDKRAKAISELNEKLQGSESTIADLKKQLETALAEKEKAEQTFEEYKKDVEIKAKLRERIDSLKAVGMEQEDWTETEEAVAEMSDKAFDLYKNQVSKTVKAEMNEEKMKKLEEEKKRKKEAKASTDIVEESKSEAKLPNSDTDEPDKDKDPFPNLTKAFENMRKNRF